LIPRSWAGSTKSVVRTPNRAASGGRARPAPSRGKRSRSAAGRSSAPGQRTNRRESPVLPAPNRVSEAKLTAFEHFLACTRSPVFNCSGRDSPHAVLIPYSPDTSGDRWQRTPFHGRGVRIFACHETYFVYSGARRDDFQAGPPRTLVRSKVRTVASFCEVGRWWERSQKCWHPWHPWHP
jgi:hypothetical protein